MKSKAARIRRAITEIGPQAVVANLCGVSPQAVNGWLRTGKIAAKHVAKLEKESGYNASWILTGEGEMRKNHVKETAPAPYAAVASTRDLLATLSGRIAETDESLRPDVVRLVTRYLESSDPPERLADAISAMLGQ